MGLEKDLLVRERNEERTDPLSFFLNIRLLKFSMGVRKTISFMFFLSNCKVPLEKKNELLHLLEKMRGKAGPRSHLPR